MVRVTRGEEGRGDGRVGGVSVCWEGGVETVHAKAVRGLQGKTTVPDTLDVR